jgi:PadR family transcriptional regulator, regulatory protein PadR
MTDVSQIEVKWMDREVLKTNTMTLALAVLSRGPQHGYQMVRELEWLSAGVLTLKEGTLYPLLHTLERDSLITSRWEAEGGRERKVYQLTDEGHSELRRRTAEWAKFRTAVDNVLGGEVLGFAGA